MKKNEIAIYTDGSSLNNPGPSGWGSIFLSNKKVLEIGGSAEEATNNQMELMAVLKSLEILMERSVFDYEITIYSDSKYFVDGITSWIYSWEKNNYKTASKKEVLNKNLWKDIFVLKNALEENNKIYFEHVKAHSGEKHNERVDDIARGFAQNQKNKESKKPKLFSGLLEKYLI